MPGSFFHVPTLRPAQTNPASFQWTAKSAKTTRFRVPRQVGKLGSVRSAQSQIAENPAVPRRLPVVLTARTTHSVATTDGARHDVPSETTATPRAPTFARFPPCATKRARSVVKRLYPLVTLVPRKTNVKTIAASTAAVPPHPIFQH